MGAVTDAYVINKATKDNSDSTNPDFLDVFSK